MVMDLMQINLACQKKRNLSETKKELDKYANDATSYEAICLAYIFLKKVKREDINDFFSNISAKTSKSNNELNKHLVIIRGLFPNKFKTNTETKYAKILKFADANEWALKVLIKQLNEKGIARIHQEYLEQKKVRPVNKIKGVRERLGHSITEYKDGAGNFIVLVGKTTATAVKIYKESTNPRIVKMVMRELGLIKPNKKEKKFSV